MNRQFPAGWLIAILALVAYLFIGSLLTGAVSLVVGVLLLVLVIWFLIYKLIYKSLGNVETVTKVYSDFTRTLERIKERLAEDEAPRRAAVDRRRQVVSTRQESRKAGTPKEFPVDRTYSDLIERRIRESRARQDQSEGSNDTES